MWKSEYKFNDSNHTSKISILQDNCPVTCSEVVQLWQHDFDFRAFFILLLADSSYKAYFWETPPITKITCCKNFEFVLINNPRLVKVEANHNNFQQYFKSTEKVVTFSNLRKDALLVVPCPIADTENYPHLATFSRHAPEKQQHLLWQTVGKQIEQKLSHQPLWVSTSGLGVYWLHIRLDSYPKYYAHQPYKQNPT